MRRSNEPVQMRRDRREEHHPVLEMIPTVCCPDGETALKCFSQLAESVGAATGGKEKFTIYILLWIDIESPSRRKRQIDLVLDNDETPRCHYFNMLRLSFQRARR